MFISWNQPPARDRLQLGRKSERKRAVRRRPLLESLEERTLLSTSIPLSSTVWTPIGPAAIDGSQIPGRGSSSGRISGIAVDPTNPDVIYVAATGGGVWKTIDGGVVWRPLTDNQATLVTGSIAIAPSNPNILYAGTGEGDASGDSFYGRGILKSTDAGSTWQLLGNAQFDRRAVMKIVVNPTDPNTVYAAVSASFVNGFLNGVADGFGVFKSTDGGSTWTNTTLSISDTDFFTDLVMDPSDPNTLYVADGLGGEPTSGVYKTTDGGGTWAIAGDFPKGNNGRIAIAISQTDPKVLYAAISNPFSFALDRMLKTTDAGATWKDTTGTPPNYLGGQGFYDNVLAVDPSDSNIVYGAGSLAGFASGNFIEGIVTSRDGGATWTDLALDSQGNGPHVDYHAAAFDSNGKLLVGNDGGIWRLDSATPGSTRWTDLNGNLQITQFVGIALSSNANVAYGGSQDNGVEKFNDARNWKHIQDGDSGFVRVDPTNLNVVYHTFFSGFDGFLERSDDGGNTWAGKTNGIATGDPSNFYVPYIMDPSNPSRLLLGTNRVYETTDRADDWAPISTTNQNGWNSDQPIDAIATAKTDGKTIYATAAGQIFVTHDDGASWTEIDVPGNSDHFADLQVDPTDSNIVYAMRDIIGGGHVFRSADGGTTWTDISGNLPDIPANSLAIDTRPNHQALYLGTDTGVFVSFNNGVNWAHFRTGMPNVRVSELDLNTNLNILGAGTYGRGMFEITVTDTLVMSLTPPPLVEGQALNNAVVATFTDIAGTDPVGNYSATIDWGDGTAASNGTIAADGKGGFTIAGSHSYAEEGTFTLTVTLNDTDGTTASKSVQVTVADAPLTATPGPQINTAEGSNLTGLVVASFTDADPAGTPSDYTATIDWGDGTTSTGQVVPNGSGGFNVQGDHLFVEGGTQGITVSIADAGGATAKTVTPAIVTDPPIFATGVTGNLVEGSSTPFLIATFTDADPNTTTSEYTVTVDWGDGTTSTASVARNTMGGFDVLGTHGYEEGPHSATVTIKDLGGSSDVAHSTFQVTDAPLTLSVSAITSIEGTLFSGEAGTFSDGNTQAPVSDFTATIDWGDGTTSAGTVVSQGGGNFVINGTKTFGDEKTYPVSINLVDVGGQATQASGSAVVSDAPLSSLGTSFTPIEGVPFSGTVATFQDLNPQSTVKDFSAAIDWGDGTTSPGVIATNPSGGFQVIGSHSFTAGLPLVVVSVNDVGGEKTQAVATGHVIDAPLTAAGAIVSATEFVPATLAVATFTDANPNGNVGQFSAVIEWGDGTSSAATIAHVGGQKYQVVGNHTYAESGTFSVQVTISDVGGSKAMAGSATVVEDFVFPITGRLNPLTDSGVSQFDNVTNVVQPNLVGTAEPNTVVRLYAQAAGVPGQTLVGTGAANASGAWSITTVPLADGSYTIFATATDPAGNVSPLNQVLPSATQGPLVIDTVGPRIVNSVLDPRRGQVTIVFADDRSGLNVASLLNPAAYAFAPNGGVPQVTILTGLRATPLAGNNVVAVVGTINNGRKLRAGSYVLTAISAAFTDLAGNPLIERTFTAFPQLGNQAPGNYVAEYNTNGQSIAGAQLFVPQSAQAAATGFNRNFRSRIRFRFPR